MKLLPSLLFLATPLAACVDQPPDPPISPAELPASGTTYVRTAEGILEVDFVRDGDRVVFQDDMTVRADEFVATMIDPERLDDVLAEDDQARAAVRAIGRYRWPGATIPWRFDTGLTLAQQMAANGAMTHWMANTPFVFVPYTNQPDFITFVSGNLDGACRSDVGRSGGEQEVEVDTCNSDLIVHELGHAVGFFHEQTRYDRDTFVTINWDNIQTEPTNRTSNFKRYVDRGRDGADAGDYDYGSIMHYGTHTFSKNGLPTIVPKQAGVTIGQTNGLSPGDIDAAFRLAGPGGTYDAGPRVTLYADPGFAGTNQSFLLGYHTATNGSFGTLADDSASSIYIPAGMIVDAYVGDVDAPSRFFGTSSATLPAPFDNSITSFQVKRAVTTYRESNRWGVSQTFPIGEWKASAGQLAVIGNDNISSLYVPPGLVVELCASESGSGCKTYEGIVNYVGDAMNDQASLIRVKPAVTLFDGENLYGERKSLPIGIYQQLSFGPAQHPSSLIVGDGLMATLCTEPNGGGRCATYFGDVNYVGGAFDNQAEWLMVQPGSVH